MWDELKAKKAKEKLEQAQKEFEAVESERKRIEQEKKDKHDKRVADERQAAYDDIEFGIYSKPIAERLTMFLQRYQYQVAPSEFNKYAAKFGLSELFAELNKNDKGRKTKILYNDNDDKIN